MGLWPYPYLVFLTLLLLSFEPIAFLSRYLASLSLPVLGGPELRFWEGCSDPTSPPWPPGGHPVLCLNSRPASATPRGGIHIPRPRPLALGPGPNPFPLNPSAFKPRTPAGPWESELCPISGQFQLTLWVVGSIYSREPCGCERVRASVYRGTDACQTLSTFFHFLFPLAFN